MGYGSVEQSDTTGSGFGIGEIMALIACPNCGHNISTLARFCPKCENPKNGVEKKTPRLVALGSSGDKRQENELLSTNDENSCSELLQREFKPSIDEMILLEGRTFLISSTVNILDCYAYLTSKRYLVCDASGVNVVFQVGSNGIVFAEEGRHLLSKKIVITTAAGETLQVKSRPHITWLNALRDPKKITEEAKKTKGTSPNAHASSVDWFYEIDGINVGPVREKFIVQLINNNHTIFPQTKVWNASLPEWKRADETILTIYFSDSAAYAINQLSKTDYFHLPGLGFLNKALQLFRKYF
jgi:hypothetical protein